MGNLRLRHLLWVSAVLALPCHAEDVRDELIKSLYKLEFKTDDEEAEKKAFVLDGELGLLISTGNSNSNSIKAGITSEHELEYWSNRYFAELLYKESEAEVDGEQVNEVTAQRFYGSAQFDYKIGHSDRRLFLYGDYEDDRFNGYDYRASIASGWSHKYGFAPNSEIRYSIGPGYTFLSVEEGEESDVNSGLILRASAEYRYDWDSGAKFRQFLSTQSGKDNTQSRSETSLSAKLLGELAMKLSFVVNHESDPTEDNKPLSTETSLALVYQFF